MLIYINGIAPFILKPTVIPIIVTSRHIYIFVKSPLIFSTIVCSVIDSTEIDIVITEWRFYNHLDSTLYILTVNLLLE